MLWDLLKPPVWDAPGLQTARAALSDRNDAQYRRQQCIALRGRARSSTAGAIPTFAAVNALASAIIGSSGSALSKCHCD